MRSIQKVTSGELVTKQEVRKKCYYIQKYVYIFKLLLNEVTNGIEGLVVFGNKSLYACIKEVCRLQAQSCFDTFHELLIMVEAQ
jgi:hypothetical protein